MSPVETKVSNHPTKQVFIDGFPITDIENPHESIVAAEVAKVTYPSDGLSVMEKFLMGAKAKDFIKETASKNPGIFGLCCHNNHFTVRYYNKGDIKTNESSIIGRYGYTKSSFDKFKAEITKFGHTIRT